MPVRRTRTGMGPSHRASENSSDETPAIFRALRRVPRATSRCMGMTQPRSPSGVIFLRTTWLPRWRSTKNPSRFKAFTASVPDTMGSLAMRQFKSVDRCWLPDGLRERFEVKVGGLLQVGKRLRLGVALAGSADFGTFRHEPVGF